MARQISPVALWSQYLAARLGAAALTTFDVQTNLHTAAALGRLVYRYDRRHRERTEANLRAAFPELRGRAFDHLTVETFEHLVQLVVEVCHAPRLIHRDSWPQRIDVGAMSETLDLLNRGRPVLLVTGHLGNWEILGYLMAVLGYRVDAIARPLDNRLINDWLLGIRQRRGMRIITKWQATDQMLDVLRAGGALGFIADQNAGDKGLFVPFFGRLASTYKSIGLLALSQNVPIICGFARRVTDGYRYEVGTGDIIYPEDWAGQPDPLYYVTARYTRAIEGMIRACPTQYLWMHRRWKSRPPTNGGVNPCRPHYVKKSRRFLGWIVLQ